MRIVGIEITGKMPCLHHSDNLSWADEMEDWKNDPDNKAQSKAGDDRTPAFRWIGSLYYDDPENGKVVTPSDNLMKCLAEGAAQVPTGKGKGTFKSRSQSGIVPADFHWDFTTNGKSILMKDIQAIRKLTNFKKHLEAAQDLGFSLFVKRVRIMNAKHVRVRPRFDRWGARGELLITDDSITDPILKKILDISGRFKGLFDWRPSSPKSPGPFGTFTAAIVSSKEA